MEIARAQHDVRTTYVGGFFGQLVSGVIWFASAAAATWGTDRLGILILVIGGFFIFPLTTLALRVSGRPASLPAGHPMNQLAVQVAFTLPLTLPLVAAVTIHHHDWFYPAFMVVLGAHYLPFVFLYGMRMFAALSGILVSTGVLLALHGPDAFTPGGWLTGGVLVVAAFVGRSRVAREAG